MASMIRRAATKGLPVALARSGVRRFGGVATKNPRVLSGAPSASPVYVLDYHRARRQLQLNEAPLRNLADRLEETLSEIPEGRGLRNWWEKRPDLFNRAQELMMNYSGGCGGITEKMAHWKENGYTRHLIRDVPGKFSLLVLNWDEGAMSPVHSHGNSKCFLRVLKGQAIERNYKNPRNQICSIVPCDEAGLCGSLELKSEAILNAGDVAWINDDMAVHAIGSHNGRCVTLHCYIPGYTSTYVYKDHNNAGNHMRADFCVDTTDTCRLHRTSLVPANPKPSYEMMQ